MSLLSVLSLIVLSLSVVVSLPAPEADLSRSATISFVMGVDQHNNPYHYSTLKYSDNDQVVAVDYHQSLALGLATGDTVQLVLENDPAARPHKMLMSGLPAETVPKKVVSVLRQEKSAGVKAASTGVRSALAIRMNYQDRAENQCSETCVMNNIYNSALSVSAMYAEGSYGQLRFDTTSSATKPRVITVSIGRSIGDPCVTESTLDTISAEGDAAVTAAGINLGQYDVRIYFTPAICGIGVAFVGEVRSYINTGGADAIAHEVGHTFGAGHASLDPANFPANFQVTFNQAQDVILEYGDVAGVMGIGGFGMRGMIGPHRFAYGWIPTSAILVPTLTACPIAVSLRTLFITPDSSAVTLVRIPRASGGNYFLSFRTPQGQDVNVRYANMVGIHSHTGGSANTLLWKYLAAGETVTTADGLVVFFARITNSFAEITVAQNGVGTACTSLSPSPSPASFSATPSFTPSTTPTPTARGTITCGQSISSTNVGAPNFFDVDLGDGADVAFIFTLTSATTMTFSTCNAANFDTMIQVFSTDRQFKFGFNDDAGGCGATSLLTVTLNPGTYFVVVDGFNGATGSFTLTASCGAPSISSSATNSATSTLSMTASVTPTTSLGSSVSSTTTPTASGTSPSPTPSITGQGTIQCGQTVSGSTIGMPNSFDVTGGDGADAAFAFAVSGPTFVTLSTCNSGTNYDTLLQVFGSNRVSFGFNDDSNTCQTTNLASVLSVTLDTGSYFVVVDGFNGARGAFVLSVTCASPSATPSSSQTPSNTAAATTTPAPSQSSTNTRAPSSSSSITRSTTGTASSTLPPSASSSVTRSQSASRSNTASVSSSVPPSESATSTRAPSPSSAETPSVTSTRTSSLTPSQTIGPSSSASVTRSQTSTASMTKSSTSSKSTVASLSASPSLTTSPTSSRTAPASATQTPSSTLTRAPSASLTLTPTSTATTSKSRTSSPSQTATRTMAASSSSSRTGTVTRTQTPTSSRTAAVTTSSTKSATASRSRTPTNSPTRSATRSRTAAVTPSKTSTSTQTPTKSSTSSQTPSKTPSQI